MAHGGHCVARVDGRVIFVRHALPGETVLVEVTEDAGGSYCRGDAVRILHASADRVSPPCPVAGPGGCGGCDWQHATPEAQRRLKADVVAEQLRRLAGLDVAVRVEELPGGPLHWRTRVRLAVAADGRAGQRAHRSHRIVPLDGCPISVPDLLDDVLDRQWLPGAEIEVVLDDAGARHVARHDPIRGSRRWRTRWLSGGRARHDADGRTWTLRADGFWQVHPAAADTLAAVVTEWADPPPGGTAWDLYGGAGLFAAGLARRVGETGSVTLVEASAAAVADAEANLRDLPWVRCVTGRVDRVLAAGLMDAAGRLDAVVLDPPRKGAGSSVVDALAAAAPGRVVYVACDPAALARDIASFATHGYGLARLRAFDAFPMTHHVECVALLLPE